MTDDDKPINTPEGIPNLAALPVAEPEKRGVGRPPYQPTQQLRNIVEVMKAGGISKDDIAKAIGIDEATLCKHFAKELDSAKTKLDAEAIGALIKLIRNGTPSAIYFYMKTQMGWKETQKHEFSRSHEDDLDALDKPNGN